MVVAKRGAILHHARRAVPAFLAAALAIGAAACGTSASSTGTKAAAATPKPTASRDPLANLTADQIATKALADVKAVTSVDVAGKMADSGQTLTFDLTLVSGKGCQGTLTESKTGSFKLIYLGKKVWIMPDQAFYKNNGGRNAGPPVRQVDGSKGGNWWHGEPGHDVHTEQPAGRLQLWLSQRHDQGGDRDDQRAARGKSSPIPATPPMYTSRIPPSPN